MIPKNKLTQTNICFLTITKFQFIYMRQRKFCIFLFAVLGHWKIIVFSHSKNKGIRWERNQQDITPLFSVLASDSNYFYGIYNDYENNYTQDQSQTMELLKKIIIENSSIQLGEDNPYIVKFKVDLKI